jgi:beta-glucanase (GH16 family)|tara:strand:+ start:15863 stop:16984 length:1122 start_codon:yes stop_codon:yes gene_type:complete
MKNNICIILLLLVSFSGCKDDEPSATLILPTNLAVTITVSETQEGQVDVRATANDENYFTIRFEDGDNTEEIEAKNGRAQHQYSMSGLYTIITKAHATTADFVQQEDTVRITIASTTNTDGVPINGATSPMSYDGYSLVWSDEFSGNSLNESNWNYVLGTGNSGWGNDELQYYQKENTSVNNGFLTIEAKQQAAGSQMYTSSRLTTRNKQSFKYGRIDIRGAMPKGQGIWPSFWMLGTSHLSVGWPDCGELDIMEMVGGSSNGKSDRVTHGTLHWDNNGQYASYGGKTTTSKKDLNQEFHVYSVIWDETSVKWLLNNRQFHETDITSSQMSEFHEEFFFIFNVAVGGRWPGSPDASTTFPQKMHVDYVRVFQK